ncbi:hypothetical protein pdam_00007092, partial [Pocillopora damicornis]
DENLVLKHEYISILESVINSEFDDVHTRLSENKLSVNIEKSNCVIIHPVKNRVPKRNENQKKYWYSQKASLVPQHKNPMVPVSYLGGTILNLLHNCME